MARHPLPVAPLALFGLTLLAACGEPETPAGPGGQSVPVGQSEQGTPVTLGRVPVVLIIFDALDAEHVGHLGYDRDTTPNLDAFAKEAVTFERAFSPAPYTLAGIASLVTGLLPDRHGTVSKTRRLRDDEWTLAELLGRVNYDTYAIVANPNGGEAFGAMQGFDEHVPVYTTSDERPVNYTDPGSGIELHIPHVEEFAPLLGGFLDGREDPSKPFLFHGHVLEPHSPYIAPEPFRTKFIDPDYDGPFADGDNQTLVASIHGQVPVEPADAQAVIDLYDGNLAYADHGFQLMIDELKQRGIYEDCLIIVTADHGEAMFQHGQWGHNDTLFDEMVQVPLLVRFPGKLGDGRARGVRRDELASIMDIVPSVCQWLDLAPPELVDGRSLAELIAGQADAATFDDRALRLRDHGEPPSLALRTEATKAILQRVYDDVTHERLDDRMAFYDLGVDPEELRDLGDSGDPRVAAAKAVIEAEMKRLMDAFKGYADATFSAEEAALMGALGYTDEDPPSGD